MNPLPVVALLAGCIVGAAGIVHGYSAMLWTLGGIACGAIGATWTAICGWDEGRRAISNDDMARGMVDRGQG